MFLNRRRGNGTTGLLTPEITISYLHTKYQCIVLKNSYHFVLHDAWVMQQVRREAMNVNYVVREMRKQSVRECSAYRKPLCVCVCSSPGPTAEHGDSYCNEFPKFHCATFL